MQRTFRITYIRTVYSDVDVAAEDCYEAEGLFEAMAAALPEKLDQGASLIKPRYRIVDVVAVDDATGKQANGRPATAMGATACATVRSYIVEPAA